MSLPSLPVPVRVPVLGVLAVMVVVVVSIGRSVSIDEVFECGISNPNPSTSSSPSTSLPSPFFPTSGPPKIEDPGVNGNVPSAPEVVVVVVVVVVPEVAVLPSLVVEFPLCLPSRSCPNLGGGESEGLEFAFRFVFEFELFAE